MKQNWKNKRSIISIKIKDKEDFTYNGTWEASAVEYETGGSAFMVPVSIKILEAAINDAMDRQGVKLIQILHISDENDVDLSQENKDLDNALRISGTWECVDLTECQALLSDG